MLHPDATASRDWPSTARIAPLHDDEVQVWRMRVDLDGHLRATAGAIAGVVTAEERERAARFRQEADRQRFLHGRLLLRTFLGHHLGIAPRAVAFVNNDFGKPEIAPPAIDIPSSSLDAERGNSVLRFNIAHSGEWVLFAVTRDREVGVDVEHHRSMSDAMDIARRFFAPPEVAALEALDAALRHDGFFRIWTRKEAIVKAHGRGLSAGLERFAVSMEAEQDASGGTEITLTGLDDDPVWRRFALHRLAMPDEYAAAVAFDRDTRAGSDPDAAPVNVAVRCFEWRPW